MPEIPLKTHRFDFYPFMAGYKVFSRKVEKEDPFSKMKIGGPLTENTRQGRLPSGNLKVTVLLPLDNSPTLAIHLSILMSKQGLTIAQAARSLGVSSRTVRRFIKSGKIHAELVPGPFGQEYRILELPLELRKPKPVDDTPYQTPVQAPIQVMDIVRELQEKNLALAAQLGAATERIRNLENEVRLLTAAKQPWWKRLFTRKG